MITGIVLMLLLMSAVNCNSKQVDPLIQCAQPPESGSCRALFYRYYFKSGNNTCEKFIYGGCSRNDNNFETLQDCMETCNGTAGSDSPKSLSSFMKFEHIPGQDVCKLPKDEGPCTGIKHMFRHYYFNGNRCVRFNYSGCLGNGNNFRALDDCVKTCERCARTERFETCGTSCPRTCDNHTEPDQNSCNEDCKIGCFCKPGFVRGPAGTCIPLRKCPNSPEQIICRLPRDRGTCKERLTRYYFDGERCKRFSYRGCGGNENNFEIRDDCVKLCGK